MTPNRTLFRFGFAVLLTVLSGCLANEKPNQTISENDPNIEESYIEKSQAQETDYIDDLIETLRSSDAVKVVQAGVHPVTAMYNRESIIPPQCYTKTEAQHNPCYVCHQNYIPNRENVMNDAELQEAYSFSDLGQTNHWKNLFVDRSSKMAKISDQEIIEWVNQDNYSSLAQRLREANFKGWIPDLTNLSQREKAFDAQGFALDNSHWVAFNYKPFPSTFWPTNGSFGDVMIRLEERYRNDKSGTYSRDVYQANLAILEATMKGQTSITTPAVDENAFQKDLNDDGKLSIITSINDVSSWVGQAEGYFIDPFLYPAGTEFFHTVRYLAIENDEVNISERMKEVRYMKKWKAYPKVSLARYYEDESFDKEAGNLPGYYNVGDYGLDNGFGWTVQSFIEGHSGELRVATFEENFFCMGCHSSIGSTIDKTFSFARKVDGAEGWGYINLKGMKDVPNKDEQQGEYVTYFERAGGGDEFRSNREMLAKWFTDSGEIDYPALAGKDVYDIIVPSQQRALKLNKAYRAIVEEQSFAFGRDTVINPSPNIHREINNTNATTLPPEKTHNWNMVLDWNRN